jgi:hypothetical protein
MGLALMGLLLASIFLLGVGTLLYLLMRLLIRLCGPTPNPVVKAPSPSDRDAELNVVIRETLRAFAADKLGAGARDEMLAYVDDMKTELRQKREAVHQPAASPTFAVPVIHPPPPSVPAVPARPPVPATPVTQRDPVVIRSAIARLHEHAQATVPTTPEQTMAVSPERSTSDSRTPETGSIGAQETLPAATPKPPEAIEPATWAVHSSTSEADNSTVSRPWTERLFTPENVRILQSLGIGLIFFSAVAYVRTQMWDDASAVAQMLILLGGTGACMGLGFALRRWTDLRITGLGFLVLAHLAMVLDAFAALVPGGMDARALYPFQPGSLWTVTLTLFTASALWHARALKEPLFEAFSFFGAVAAWGAGAQWLGLTPWQMASAYVPALLICRLLYPLWHEANERSRRWSLPWWFRSAWELCTPLLAAVEVALILIIGQNDPHGDLWRHLSSLLVLGSAMLWDAQASERKHMAHFGCVALLAVWPLAAFTGAWAWWAYPMTLALPAAGLTLLALAWSHWQGALADEPSEMAARWGITSVTVAAATAAAARLIEPAAAVSATWSAVALTGVGVTLVVIRASREGTWLTAIGTAMLSAMVLDLTGIGLEWMPMLWLSFALAAELFSMQQSAHPLATTGRDQADLLTLGAALGGAYFCIHQPHAVWAFATTAPGLYGPAPLYQLLIWLAFTSFMLVSSFTRRCPKRRVTGVVLLGPTLLYALSTTGLHFATPSIWSCVLAAVVWFVAEALTRHDHDLEQRHAGWSGAGLLLLQGALLSLLDLLRPDYGMAAWDYLALSGVVSAVALRCRIAALEDEACIAIEAVGLGLLSASAVCCAATFDLDPIQWAALMPLLAALTLLFALIGEQLAGTSSADRPFRTAGEIIALAIGMAGLGRFLFEPDLLIASPLAVIWLAGLPMFFLSIRTRLTTAGDALKREEPRLSAVVATTHVLITVSLCVGLSLYRAFWAAGVSADVRAESALFYSLLLLFSIGSGIWLRSALAPALGGCAALALAACAYGGWKIPYETFGLPAMVTALALLSLGVCLRRTDPTRRSGQTVTSCLAGSLAALFACGYLMAELMGGQKTGLQAASVVAWLLAAGTLWYAGRNGLAGLCGFGCGLSLLLAGMHGLRWGAVEFTAFGPAIGAFALALLAAREIAEFLDVPEDVKPDALRGRAAGLLVVACGSMLLAGIFALFGQLDNLPWHWVGTLCEGALFLGALTVLSRRRNAEAPAGLLLLAEMGLWLALLMALGFGVSTCGYGNLLQGAVWAGIGALVLLLGMIFESVAGAVIGPSAQARVPGAFLESRHLAAAFCGALALVTALIAPHAVERVWMTGLWQACLGAALLAIYGSLARSSISAEANLAVRYGCALSSYVILLPLGYLAFLKSQSTGDSWGALWFLALAPALLGVAWLLEQEHEKDQAGLARIGALLVSGGALVLAFAANNGCLAEVPAWTLLGLSLESLLMRRWHQRKEWTVVALAALSGAVFYGMRSIRGDPAWGMPEAWVYEGTVMAALGLLLTVLGGLTGWERDKDGRSIGGMCGFVLTAISIGLMLTGLLAHGTGAAYLGIANSARLDAFSVALILSGGTAWAASHWLGFTWARWLAPAQLLAAYGLSLWAWHVLAWEYYTIPAALACFFWAWQSERPTSGHDALASRVWQLLGSALLLIPSFVQAMPYTRASVAHFFTLAALALLLVGGAMWARRKIPLLSASSALLLCTIIKTAQWAANREVVLPVAGIGLGFAVLAVGCLFESRMNRALRTASDQVKAQAKMFWINWE